MNPLLRSLFEEHNLDAIMLSDKYNIGYMTEFWGSFGRLFLLKTGEKKLISHSLYTQEAKRICARNNIEYRNLTQNQEFFKDFCEEFSIARLGIESKDITLERFEGMKKGFQNIDLIPLTKTIEDIRLVKTEQEVEKLKIAAQIGDKALLKTTQFFEEGITEKEIAWIFEKTAREELGADGLSFPPVVAFGKNSAKPHHDATDKKLEKNMPILIDCGVKKDKYCSDLTRCFWFGEKNTPEYSEWKAVYDIVHASQKAGIKHMIAGENIAQSDKVSREIMGKDEKYFGHAFGHGVGIEVHESPVVSSGNKKEIYQKNMVVTAEPGIYFPGKFGIRIEDLLVVRDNDTEFLSKYEYEEQ